LVISLLIFLLTSQNKKGKNMEPKNKLDSVTNWVAILSPILTAAVTAMMSSFGVPISAELIATLLSVSTLQSIATWIARNRKGGGGQTTGNGMVIPG
jgi:hypothetical protein